MKRCLRDARYECIYGHESSENHLSLLAHFKAQCLMCVVEVLAIKITIPQWSRQMLQPTLWREGDAKAHGCIFQGRKTRGVATNVYLRKTL